MSDDAPDREAPGAVLGVVTRLLLPYPDPRRRRTVRQDAARLVSIDVWPGNDARNAELAHLALLRILSLQDECHRAARRDHLESAVLLARAAIETLAVGTWMLHVHDPIPTLQRQSAKSVTALTNFITSPGLVPKSLIEPVIIQAVGQPGPPPSLRSLIDALEPSPDTDVLRGLYEHYYQPLSSLFGHGSPLALLRHVDGDGHLAGTPARSWSHRFARHMVDFCLGLLAADIAEAEGKDPTPYRRYARAHGDRLLVPGAFIALAGAPKILRWSALPSVMSDLLAMRRLCAQPSVATTTEEYREAQLTLLATNIFSKAFRETSDDDRKAVIAAMVKHLVAESRNS